MAGSLTLGDSVKVCCAGGGGVVGGDRTGQWLQSLAHREAEES